MKVAIVGANGQLGSDLVDELAAGGWQVCEWNLERVDVTRGETVREAFAADRPEVVINTAAMHQVEQCEADPARSFAVNASGVRDLALEARRNGAWLVHISTDYVFDGAKGAPYVESDLPRPLNVYGVSKLAGEHFVSTLQPDHYIVRTSGLYGHHPCLAKGGLNFVELMRKLSLERPEIRVVDSEVLTPTSTREVARQLRVMLERRPAPGLYHVTAEGSCSWHAFAAEIFRQIGATAKLSVAAPGEFPAKVPRPTYSVL
ncbi:MAG TPA: dTDP-4-dehydrorhamnose reductase, partial [Candidatus Aminicenantes bacterium]|nr:dTDP-4-dehydrorhamnose reductase [Candidatus Aminicenantes bacterium]